MPPPNYAQFLSGVQSPVDRVQQGVLFGQQQQDRQTKQDADAAFKADLTALSQKENLTTDDLVQFGLKNPGTINAYKPLFEAMGAQEKQTKINDMTTIYAALTNGKPGAAIDFFEQKKLAAENSGNAREAASADAMIRSIQLNPNAVKANFGVLLASEMGPSQFDNMQEVLGVGGGGGESFTTPQAGVDDEGNAIFFTTDKSGIKKVIPGVKPRDNITQVDSETETFLYNKEGVLLKTIDKQTGEGAKIRAANKLQADREIDLINMETDVGLTIDVIDQIIGNEEKGIPEHPGLVAAVGSIDVLTPTFFPTTRDFEILAEQLQGKAFLTAYQTLKGGGPITDIEGVKAEAAQARLNKAQSETAYRSALREMRQLLVARLAKARKLAGVGGVNVGKEVLQNGWWYRKDENGKMVPVRKEDG